MSQLARWVAPLLALGTALLGQSAAFATTASAAPSGPTSTPMARAAAPGATSSPLKTVRYRSVGVRVPASWPVIDLDADPSHCVRLDRAAVYLGTPSADQDCPAHAVGRSGTVWLAPSTPRARSLAATGRSTTVGGMRARVIDGAARERQVVLPDEGVVVRTAWGADATVTQRAEESITPLAGPVADQKPVAPDAGVTAGSSAASPSGISAGGAAVTTAALRTAAGPTAVATASPTRKVLDGGMAFDACAAPSTSTMSAWRGSPYAAVGIYIGGSMRACGDGNLSSSWVSTVSGYGWGLIPIYVGAQAPCVYQSGLAHISVSNASAQGRSNAADAVVQAKRFGLGAGSVIYYDMEAYATGNASCTGAVLDFVTAWTAELRRQGYLSGVYGSPASLMSDMSRAFASGDASFTPPDHVWYAHWNQRQDLVDSASYPAFKDRYWSRHQRLHQYAGGHNETWGGRTINIDSNWVDATLPGNATQLSYGTGILGPGSAGFVFTGSMGGWNPQPGQGAKGAAYFTNSTATTREDQGATWSPSLRPALYAVDAYIPDTGTTGTAAYTVTHAQGTSATTIAQWQSKGYRRVGTYLALAGKPITVHMGDSGSVSTARKVSADAMRFTVVGTEPGAPDAVSGAPGDGRVTVSWSAAPANGASVAGYTVTASPGGRTMTVDGSARSVTMTGLSNGTGYTFAVRATNIVGDGPTAVSGAVVPTAAGRVVAVTPTRVLDTRRGTTANPTLSGVLAPRQRITVHLTGSGTPVPSGATSVVVNVTATRATRGGYVADGASGTSLLNLRPGATVANLATLRVAPNGTATLVNGTSGTLHLVADVQGYISPAASGGGEWTATVPTRLLDTRYGAVANLRSRALGPGESIDVRIGGASGSPVTATALAAALRLTTVNATQHGYLTASNGSTGGTSVLNYGAGSVVGNVALASLSPSGTVRITNHSAGAVDVLVDLQGQVTPTGSLWTPVTPGRVLDTRRGTSANPGAAIIPAGGDRVVRIAGVPGSPVPSGAVAASVNLTVVPTTGGGWLSAAAARTTTSSVVNFRAHTVVASLTVVSLARDGSITVHNGSRQAVELVVDVQGYAR